jgi:hypothetical protein
MKLHSSGMAGFLDKPVSPPAQQGAGSGSSAPRPPWPGGIGEIRFVPARWILVLAAVVARLLLKGGTLGKFGIVGLVWAFAPRKLKVAAAGFAAAAMIVLVGAVAAITLLTLQLS